MNNSYDPGMQNQQGQTPMSPQMPTAPQQQPVQQPPTQIQNQPATGQTNYVNNFLNQQQSDVNQQTGLNYPSQQATVSPPIQTNEQSNLQFQPNLQSHDQMANQMPAQNPMMRQTPEPTNFSQNQGGVQQSMQDHTDPNTRIKTPLTEIQPHSQPMGDQGRIDESLAEELIPEPVAEKSVNTSQGSPQIGTHQLDVQVNEDYAESFFNTFQQHAPGFNLNKQPEPQVNDFAHPSQNLVVDNQFSDMDIQSAGMLPPFDDSNDTGLTTLTDDTDLEEESESDEISKFGFSDFDPNEQIGGATEDDLANFEAQSLAQTSDGIDADWSETMPTHTNQQQVGVLEPQDVNMPSQASIKGDLFTQPNFVNNYLDQRAEVTKEEVTQLENNQNTLNTTQQTTPAQPEPMHVANTQIQQESPAAKLNQLLEAEDAAEKVILEKQDKVNSVPVSAPEPDRSHIFKQISSDTDFAPEMQKGMKKSSSSKYFLILSLIIVISVIGFLLVLLGLSLLE